MIKREWKIKSELVYKDEITATEYRFVYTFYISILIVEDETFPEVHELIVTTYTS